VLDSAAAAWGVQARLASAVPLGRLALAGGLLLATLALVGLVLAVRVRRAGAGPTWDCGYAAPTARMQYTSSSFAQMLVGMFSFALHPKEHPPHLAGAFPAPAAYHGEVPDAVLDRLIAPALRGAGRAFEALRFIQRGDVQAYLTYILLTLVLFLVWT
jgi:hydrogenase-4 component B